MACAVEANTLFNELRCDSSTGLSQQEARRRLQQFGANEMEVGNEEPMWKRYLDGFKDPMIALLLASAAVSLVMGQYDDAISITLAVIIVTTVAFVQEYRSDKSLEALGNLAPHRCRVLRGGRVVDVLAADVVVGDVVVVAVGDRMPADVRLFETVDLEIDESRYERTLGNARQRVVLLTAPPPSTSLTGENLASAKHTRPLASAARETELAERNNIGYMGTLVTHGRGRGVVIGTGLKTEFGSVFQMMQGADEPRTPLQQRMDALGKRLRYTPMTTIVCKQQLTRSHFLVLHTASFRL